MKKKIIPLIAVVLVIIVGIIIFKRPKKFSDYTTTEDKMYVSVLGLQDSENEYLSFEYEVGQEEILKICEVLKGYKFYRCFDTIKGGNTISYGEKDSLVVISMDNHSITICTNGKVIVDNKIYKTKSKEIVEKIKDIIS